jgi:hypothetical protein
MAIKCPKCQADNPDTQSFCGDCGTQLTPSESIPEVTRTIETPSQELTRGTLFAERYEIIEELGKGGMGNVYRVEDTRTKEDIALKLIKPECQKNEALRWLEKACEERAYWIVQLKIDEDFDVLRDEPRFLALLEKMGLN